jgi:transcriptional regulator with XRE-family HTH domain
MHRTFLGHLETGRKDFRLTTIIRVADALGITLGELFAGLETEEPFKSKRGNRLGRPDLSRLRKELAVLERSLGRVKDLACDPPSARVKTAKAAPTTKTRRTSKKRA